jgi:O-antigen ligase
MRPERVLFLVIFHLLLAFIALAPLPFGAVPVWAWSIMAATAGALTVAWGLSSQMRKSPHSVPLQRIWPFLLSFGLTVGWALLQASSVMPQQWWHPLWSDAAAALGRPLHGSIALDPGAATAGAIRLTGYGAIFWLAVQYGRDPRNAQRSLQMLALAGFIYAVYGLLEYFSGTETVLWYPKFAYIGDATSAFINRNNYATYAGLGLLSMVGLFFQSVNAWLDRHPVRIEGPRALVEFFERRGWIYLLGMAIVASALLYTHSRGGFTSTLAGIIGFCLASAVNRSVDKRFARWFTMTCLAIVAVFFLVGGRIVSERLASSEIAQEERPAVYELTMKAIKDQPLLGSGLGSFEQTFRFYRTLAIQATYLQAHDTYLELGLELGIPATVTLLVGILYIVATIAVGTRTRRKDSVYPCVGLGATALVGTHALVDFSIQIPAIAASYALILGVAFAQSWSSRV